MAELVTSGESIAEWQSKYNDLVTEFNAVGSIGKLIADTGTITLLNKNAEIGFVAGPSTNLLTYVSGINITFEMNTSISLTTLAVSGTSTLGTANITTSDIGTLSINSAYTLPTADGTSSQVLTTNGSGTVTWASTGLGGTFIGASDTPAAYTSLANQVLFINSTPDAVTSDSTFTFDAGTNTLTTSNSTTSINKVLSQMTLGTSTTSGDFNYAKTYSTLSSSTHSFINWKVTLSSGSGSATRTVQGVNRAIDVADGFLNSYNLYNLLEISAAQSAVGANSINVYNYNLIENDCVNLISTYDHMLLDSSSAFTVDNLYGNKILVKQVTGTHTATNIYGIHVGIDLTNITSTTEFGIYIDEISVDLTADRYISIYAKDPIFVQKTISSTNVQEGFALMESRLTLTGTGTPINDLYGNKSYISNAGIAATLSGYTTTIVHTGSGCGQIRANETSASVTTAGVATNFNGSYYNLTCTGAGSSITNMYGIYLDMNLSSGGVATNRYGIYINSSGVANTIDRSIYVATSQAAQFNCNILLDEQSSAPVAPTSGNQASMYMKADKLVVRYGSIWWTLDLTASSNQSWVRETSEPT